MNNHSPNSKLLALMNETTMKSPKLPLLPSSKEFSFPPLTKQLDILLTKYEMRKKLLLPELRNHDESLAIFSDYSGEHKDSKYYTYTFFVTTHGLLFWFEEQMKRLRAEFFQSKLDKEISYKDIQWGGIKRSLKSYLSLADKMPGLLLTVVIDKRIKTFFHNDSKFIYDTLKNAGLGEWKPSIAEKLLRVTHLVAYIITLLSKDEQKVFWMSDHDSILQGKDLSASKIVNSLLEDYGRKTPKIFGFATPFEERSLLYLDALSLTDLVAGALQHYFTQELINSGRVPVKNECADITDWLGHQSFLKKHCVMFRYLNNNDFVASNIAFECNSIPKDTLLIPIYR